MKCASQLRIRPTLAVALSLVLMGSVAAATITLARTNLDEKTVQAAVSDVQAAGSVAETAEPDVQMALQPALPTQVAQMAEEYQRALQDRDRIIADLLRRVQLLEQANASGSGTPGSASAAAVSAGSDRPGPAVQGGRPAAASAGSGRPDVVAQASRPAGAPGNSGQPGPAVQDAQPAAPADAGLSEEEINRALERTLVQVGGLLLPEYAVEVTPTLSYTYGTVSPLTLVSLPNGTVQPVNGRIRNDTLEASLDARVGLPWNTQAEISL